MQDALQTVYAVTSNAMLSKSRGVSLEAAAARRGFCVMALLYRALNEVGAGGNRIAAGGNVHDMPRSSGSSVRVDVLYGLLLASQCSHVVGSIAADVGLGESDLIRMIKCGNERVAHSRGGARAAGSKRGRDGGRGGADSDENDDERAGESERDDDDGASTGAPAGAHPANDFVTASRLLRLLRDVSRGLGDRVDG